MRGMDRGHSMAPNMRISATTAEIMSHTAISSSLRLSSSSFMYLLARLADRQMSAGMNRQTC